MAKKLTLEQKTEIIMAYRLAYEAANPGKRVTVENQRGWYQLVTDGRRGSKYRIGQLVTMTETLNKRVAEGRTTPEYL